MHLLLVEDDVDLAANVRDYLHALGHEVAVVGDGLLAQQRLASESYDLLILDCMLPQLDGVSLCQQLRQSQGHTLPVIMLTALGGMTDKIAGFEAGADDYLVKPFSLVELKLRIEALARRSQLEQRDTELVLGDLQFSPQTLQASRQGQRLNLNPTTRKLLEFFLRNPQRVVARHELEQLLWGDEPPQDDALRMHISNLRAAIDRPFEVKLLHTVHGVGYRLANETHP